MAGAASGRGPIMRYSSEAPLTERCPVSGGGMRAPSVQSRDLSRLAGQLQNVQPSVGAIDHIDVAAIVGLHIVALDRDLAAVLSVDLDAALVRRLGDRRDKEARFLRLVGIADIDRAHARIEERHERELAAE